MKTINQQKVHKYSEIAQQLVQEHLGERWTFKVGSYINIAGKTHPIQKWISVSRKHIVDAPDTEIIDTILHEIAHAIVGCQHNHDEVWKRTAKRIGAKPQETSNSLDSQMSFKYYIYNPLTNTVCGRSNTSKTSWVKQSCCFSQKGYPNSLGKLKVLCYNEVQELKANNIFK